MPPFPWKSLPAKGHKGGTCFNEQVNRSDSGMMPGDPGLILNKLEQLERLCSEIHIRSQVKTRQSQSYKF